MEAPKSISIRLLHFYGLFVKLTAAGLNRGGSVSFSPKIGTHEDHRCYLPLANFILMKDVI